MSQSGISRSNESDLRRLFASNTPGVITSANARTTSGTGSANEFGRQILVFSSLGSTNTHARELAAQGAPEGTVVVSRSQTAGRGRQGRTWESEAGKNLLCSVILRPRIDPEYLGIVSLYASVAVAAAVGDACGKSAGCKWPNDVVIAGRKISGILSESVITPTGVDAVILGIGLNVNQEHFPEGTGWKQQATSLRLETGHDHDLATILFALLVHLERGYADVTAAGAFHIINEWTRRSVILGSKVSVEQAGSSFSGVARAVSPTGALRVETPDGLIDVVSGEVHLR